MKKVFFLFLACCLTLACGSQKTIEKDDATQLSINKLAIEKFNRPARIETNDDSTYSIVSARTKTLKMLFATVDFFVFDHKTSKVIYEDTLEGGSVSWESTFEIKATNRGSETEGIEKYSYIYNCKTDKKTDVK